MTGSILSVLLVMALFMLTATRVRRPSLGPEPGEVGAWAVGAALAVANLWGFTRARSHVVRGFALAAGLLCVGLLAVAIIAESLE